MAAPSSGKVARVSGCWDMLGGLVKLKGVLKVFLCSHLGLFHQCDYNVI